ncbi:Epoxyqueuosine reductase [Maioricimonas rarisocia]|uniref:Epoxyqueuosine reductase n=1 Tax=Maioricimonas rarisocia TaxID=2528026 RepID=A0A517Z8W1_9PLAN|nr:tRNA epoxyqueuosine(34) reductase QueG [Maioricimonas rarisocia]QDU38889.1 Epoxyqueuosine reductase [Maioricimonas rarisocia]
MAKTMTQSDTNIDETNTSALAAELKRQAATLGFQLVGIAPATAPESGPHFERWLERGFAGQMEYIPRRREAYGHPEFVLESVRSVVMLAANYNSGDDSGAAPDDASLRIARYARSTADYHDVLKSRVKQLANWLHDQCPGCRTRGVVDTAPLLERDFARRAGLGWFGKNTMLINKRMGSWFFLAALLTDVDLPADQTHETSHCGTCTRCLEACPTDAFPEPHVLDARRCISYLTIELRGEPIPAELRPGIGEWLFGCDVCQDVCPWNRKAPQTNEPQWTPVLAQSAETLGETLRIDEAAFRERYRKHPIWRIGRDGLVRNACIVTANLGESRFVPDLVRLLADASSIVRGAAAWALGRLGGEVASQSLAERSSSEDDPTVTQEIAAALAHLATED